MLAKFEVNKHSINKLSDIDVVCKVHFRNLQKLLNYLLLIHLKEHKKIKVYNFLNALNFMVVIETVLTSKGLLNIMYILIQI